MRYECQSVIHRRGASFRPAWAVMAAACWLAAFAPPAAAEEEATVEAMRRAWAERRAKIESLYCEIALEEYTLVDPSAERLQDPFAPPEPPSPKAEPTLTLEGNVRFWIAGEKMALRLDPTERDPVHSSIGPATRREMTFDGTLAKDLDYSDLLNMGSIAREPWLSHEISPKMLLRGVSEALGIWLSIDPIVGLEATGMVGLDRAGIDSSPMTIKRSWTDDAGDRYLEINIPSMVPHRENSVHVNVTRGYLPVRVERKRDGQTTTLVTLEYTEDPELGWRIAEWTDSLSNLDYPPDTTRYRTVERFEVNRPIADEVFELPFPEGTHVHELVGEDEVAFAYYVAGTGGVVNPISEAEYGVFRESEPVGDKRSTGRLFMAVALAVFAICCMFVLVRRRRRR